MSAIKITETGDDESSNYLRIFTGGLCVWICEDYVVSPDADSRGSFCSPVPYTQSLVGMEEGLGEED